MDFNDVESNRKEGGKRLCEGGVETLVAFRLICIQLRVE